MTYMNDRPANTLEGFLEECDVRAVPADDRFGFEYRVTLRIVRVTASDDSGRDGLPREQIKPGRVRITIEALP